MIKLIKKMLKNTTLILVSLLIAGFVARLYKLNNPVADWHSWRQADTASVTREYVKKGLNLLYPSYQDISSIQTGIFNPEGWRFVEFPIFNLIHYYFIKLGFLSFDAWGRMVSIVASTISGFLLYLIGSKIFNKWVGVLSAGFFMLMPFNIYFSRVILPEPLAVMFGLFFLYYSVNFIDTEKNKNLYLAGASLSLALLIKPFLMFYAIPVLYLFITKYGFKRLTKDPKILIPILIASNIALAPFFAWRIWINRYPLAIPFFEWAFNGDGIRFKPSFWRWIFSERLANLMLGGWGIFPFVFGVITKPKEKFDHFVRYFLLGALLYVTIIATANVRHDYYQTIVVPAVALTLGFGTYSLWNLKKFNRKVLRVTLVFSLFIMFISGAVQIKEDYKINHPEIIEAGQAVKRIAPSDSLIVAPYDGDTALLYQTGMSGWPAVDTSFDKIIERGADYFVSVTLSDPDIKYLEERYKVVEETGNYVIIDLHAPLTK